jgi:2-octaprenyl-6-methoxyphenol hydroxylase
MKKLSHDVIIIGGGPAGLSMACLLGQKNYRVACIDREPPDIQALESFDGRTTAISCGSRQVLEAAGVWDHMSNKGCPIEIIEISDGDSPTLVTFDHRNVGQDAFGWIFENRDLRRALFAQANQDKNVDHIAPAQISNMESHPDHIAVTLSDGREFSASLLIGADGRQSTVREWAGIGNRAWSYEQHAVICTVRHTHPHKNIAIENFRPEGPFAVLPMNDDDQGHRSSVVWSLHGPIKDSLLHASDEVFSTALNARFPDFYGSVKCVSKRAAYPLGLIHAHNYTAHRVALIGDAAHGIHPIAGQGLNLGFRDIACLAEVITSYDDIGSAPCLAAFERKRRPDNMAMAATTDILNRLFSNNISPIKGLRRAGLRIVDKTKPVKKFFMKQAMGMGHSAPSLLSDLANDKSSFMTLLKKRTF